MIAELSFQSILMGSYGRSFATVDVVDSILKQKIENRVSFVLLHRTQRHSTKTRAYSDAR
jgi:hypothetical protein